MSCLPHRCRRGGTPVNTGTQTQGWGIIPTWFGAQPSTACLTGSTPGNCTKYFTITINPANANAQGVAEATAAINSAQSLNTCCIVIYKNIENYVTATDGTAVRAFLSGWATQLHNSGYQAAVYGNPGPAATDFSKDTPALDDAWLAKSNKQ